MASGSRGGSPEPSASNGQNDAFSPTYTSIDDVLEDLSTRFIMNLPDNQLASIERVCFQVEQAHWFYEDFIRESNPQFPSLPQKKFSEMLFQACPLIKHWSGDFEQAFDNFMLYKTRVPVCGAIMLNAACDKCVLVKGWKSSSGWGFPKGKINQGELTYKCAIREVLEETGYDVSDRINPDDVIVVTIKEQRISLFVVPGVPEDFHFETRTRKEISKIEWFKLVDLPTWKRNKIVPGKFYLITPFIGPLRTFINERKARNSGRGDPSQTREPRQRGHRTRNSHAFNSVDTDVSRTNGARKPDGIDIQALDPHMARLLNNLSISAQNQEVPAVGAYKPAPTDSFSGGGGVSRPGSTHPSASSVTASPYLHIAPPAHEGTTHVNGANSKGDGAARTPAPLPLTMNDSNTSPEITPRSAALSSVWTASATSSGSAALDAPARIAPSRQGGSSVGDISPYLSRVTEIPTSGRRLKQLALLESVVDDTARRAAVARTSTAMGMHGPSMNPAAPSLSVPPSPMDAGSPYQLYGHPQMDRSPNMPRALPGNAMHPTPAPYPNNGHPVPRPVTALEWNRSDHPQARITAHQQTGAMDHLPRPPLQSTFPMRPGPGLPHVNGPPGPQQLSYPGAALPSHLARYNSPYGGPSGQPSFAGPLPPSLNGPSLASGYHPAGSNTVPILPVRPLHPPSGPSSSASAANLLSILNSPTPPVQYRTPTNLP